MKYDISVVMGSKNRKNLIKATINSIRNNGFNGNIEIIVVDGGSTDGTCDWLAKQKDVFTIIQPNYNVINEKGIKVRAHSWGEFMNIGFKAAHSDFICMVSDDLILAPGCLQKGYDEIRRKIEDGEKIGGGAFFFREYPRGKEYKAGRVFNNFVLINHGYFYKPALEKIGWLDEITYNFYCGDGDIAIRLNESGWRTIFLEDCFALHLSHPPMRSLLLSEWVKEDIKAYHQKYDHYEAKGNIEASRNNSTISPWPFWKNAFFKVMVGYITYMLNDIKKK